MATPLSTKLKRNLLPIAAVTVGIAVAAALLIARTGTEHAVGQGLPRTRDYHSLLVSPSDPGRLVLGTHNGLYTSGDGGRTWARAELAGQDAMNLGRAGGETLWAAGHGLLARSTDGGTTWSDVRPEGLPGLDVHGFAVDPAHPRTIYAAIAGEGLYRSTDGGESFDLRSREVGPGVMAIAVLPSGRLLVGDMQREQLLESRDGGTTWHAVAEAPILGLAVDPGERTRVLAAGPRVLLSTDGGATWRQTLELAQGSGPIGWAPSDSRRAYVVGFDRSLHTTSDGGETWQVVVGGKEKP